MIWVSTLVHGVLLGGVYALLAAGLALMFGVMRIINLAHGSLALVGAYMAYLVTEHLHISTYLALALVLPGGLIVGYLLQRTMLERSLRAGQLVPLLTTFGLLIVIANLLQEFFSPNVQSLNEGSIGTASFSFSSISIAWFDVLTFAVAVVVLGGLQLVLSLTQLGRELRATAEDADTAELVGIDARSVYARATAIAVATAALAGVFYGMRSSFDPNAGADQLLYAFEAVVIGGIGSLWGTLGGGVLLGVSQSIGEQINPEYFELAGNLVFLIILIARTALQARGMQFRLRRGGEA